MAPAARVKPDTGATSRAFPRTRQAPESAVLNCVQDVARMLSSGARCPRRHGEMALLPCASSARAELVARTLNLLPEHLYPTPGTVNA